MDNTEPIIELHNVQQSFETPSGTVEVIKHASLAIRRNTINIIYGPSGSGKSTLMHILSGLQKPTHGRVLVEGRDIYALDPEELAKFRANRIGIVYQANYWVGSLNVLDNVSLPLNFLGYDRPKAHTMARSALERVGMEIYADKQPTTLSGGEQQRIAMARALAATPLFIMADEPTGNLDAASGNRIIEQMLISKYQLRNTIVFVTHNIEYLPIADHVFRVSNGTVQEVGPGGVQSTVDELLKDLQNNVIRKMAEKYKK